MMIKRYNDFNWRQLLREPATENGLPEALPRQTRYGSIEAGRLGLIPVQDYPDILIDPKDYKEVIEHCHEKQIFPMYHQDRSGVMKDGWDQDGLGYCWAFGMTAALMDCRALEGQDPVRLAPTSLGFLVNWQNAGNYLDSAIQGARERGIAPATHVPELSIRPREFKTGWEDEALKYRLSEVWDTNAGSGAKAMIQQCLSILALGRAGYIAYDWWGHALEMVGYRWDQKAANNVVPIIRNSHGEDDYIEIEGSRGVPDEFYGIRTASLPDTV